MGKIRSFKTTDKILNFINDYKKIKDDYELRFKESINREPYESINNYPLNECKYKVSLVISTWNSCKSLKMTLRTIENTYICNNFNDKLEVVLVDDGSDDETFELINSNNYNFNLKYIKQVHLGRAQGINLGVSNATGEMIIFLDSDILLFPYTIDEIVKRQQEYLHDVICFGFREDVFDIPENEEDIIEYVNNYNPKFWLDNRFTYDFKGSFGSNMMLETNMMLNYSTKKNIWVSNNINAIYDCWQVYRMVYGFLFAVSKKNFESFGGFAEFLVGWGCDDTLFVSLAVENNLKLIPVPSAHCLHIYHDIRMKSQWEDGKKNEERMYNYISKNNRINFLDNNYESRIISRIDKQVKFVPHNIKKIIRKNNSNLEEANYHYYLGNLEKSLNLYKKISSKLDIANLENLFDIIVRLGDKRTFNNIKNINNRECFFYHLGNYIFNDKVDYSGESKSIYFNFLNNINLDELEERAEQYLYEKQYYLSLLDYFGIYIKSQKNKNILDEIINKLQY